MILSNKENNLSAKEKALLIGSLLGDGFLQKTPAFTGKVRFRVGHSKAQKDYLLYKYKILKRFCEKVKPAHDFLDHGYPACKFYTSYCEEFIPWHDYFYEKIVKNNKTQYKKVIRSDIKKHLTDPYSLAIWFCDDGTLRKDCDSGRIATQSFSKEEVLTLMDSLKKNYNIETSLDTWTNKKKELIYGIAILAKSGNWNKFRELIKDIIEIEIPSMTYKLYKPG
uniref:Putative LAGLIDADG homing endonuclease n=1 Tax=Jenufa perforata TaxID=993091 RepID=A0A0S2LNA0_9CHLO|nr:putative LAGLIDADG homing endonuclease [Jenufa perforata]ALO62913.1 putative LAGLIDADG homing endonuclease [Jenufa perforata]